MEPHSEQTVVVNPSPILIALCTVFLFALFAAGAHQLYQMGVERYGKLKVRIETEFMANAIGQLDDGKDTKENLAMALTHYTKALDSCIMTLETIHGMSEPIDESLFIKRKR